MRKQLKSKNPCTIVLSQVESLTMALDQITLAVKGPSLCAAWAFDKKSLRLLQTTAGKIRSFSHHAMEIQRN